MVTSAVSVACPGAMAHENSLCMSTAVSQDLQWGTLPGLSAFETRGLNEVRRDANQQRPVLAWMFVTTFTSWTGINRISAISIMETAQYGSAAVHWGSSTADVGAAMWTLGRLAGAWGFLIYVQIRQAFTYIPGHRIRNCKLPQLYQILKHVFPSQHQFIVLTCELE